MRLVDLGPGEAASFERVSDSDPEMLRFLDERGIHPGCELRLRRRDPFEGPLFVEVDGSDHVLGHTLAAAMWVTPAEGSR